MTGINSVACSIALALGVGSSVADAASYPWPKRGESMIGSLRQVSAAEADTFVELARHHGLGYQELVLANPSVDRWLPGEGAEVLLPTRYILPSGPREGIVINIAEMRLYYYEPGTKTSAATVYTFPVGVGRDDWKTPQTSTTVSAKVTDPAWRPPPGIIKEHAERGDILPNYVPPGPDNPLGKHLLKLAIGGGYYIHGTPKRFGIGMPVTHGCVRMFGDDIELLHSKVSVKTPVRIINQAIKTAWHHGRLYVEVHADVNDNATVDFDQLVEQLNRATSKKRNYPIDWDWVDSLTLQPRGVPLPVNIRVDYQG